MGYRVLDSYDRTDRFPRERLPIATKLDGVLLQRLLSYVEAQLPNVALSFFGQKVNLGQMRRRFSPGEPAINIYTAGGEFNPHTDKEHLTLLIPLDPPGAFEGGGTAFWSDGHIMPSTAEELKSDELDPSRWLPHDHTVRALAGTAVIFGGDVTHAGLRVTAGTRHLFVMSFKLLARSPAEVLLMAVQRDAMATEEIPVGEESLAAGVDEEALSEFMDVFI